MGDKPRACAGLLRSDGIHGPSVNMPDQRTRLARAGLPRTLFDMLASLRLPVSSWGGGAVVEGGVVYSTQGEYIQAVAAPRIQAGSPKKSFLFGPFFFNITNVFCAKKGVGHACICPRMVTG